MCIRDSHDTGGGTEIYKDMAFAAAFPTMEERSAAIWKRIFENYRSYSFSEFLELLRNKLLFAWNNSMFESSEYLLWPIDSNWTFYITQPQFLPTQLIRAYSTIYMLFLYAANILSAGVALFRKKINFTFIPNLFVFGTMLYLLIFENAPRRAMIAVPFMIYNVIFLLSQWRDKPDGAQSVSYTHLIHGGWCSGFPVVKRGCWFCQREAIRAGGRRSRLPVVQKGC